MVSITVLATCILCTIKMVQLHPFSLSSCSQVDLPPRYSTGTSSIMERSPNTLNIIVLLKCIQFLTELRHGRMLISGMQKHPPLRIDHVLAHERESAQVQDMMTLSYHIAQVSCRPIGNGASIGGKTFPHSELEKHQSSDFTYAVVVFRRRNDIILTQFGVQIVNGRHDDRGKETRHSMSFLRGHPLGIGRLSPDLQYEISPVSSCCKRFTEKSSGVDVAHFYFWVQRRARLFYVNGPSEGPERSI